MTTTGRTRLASRLVDRLPSADDDTGSLVMAMIVVILGGMLGALILPMVLTQQSSTRFDENRVHALHEAQTGVDVMLGLIRSGTKADTGTGTGQQDNLPCNTFEPARQPGDAGGFKVSISYTYDKKSAQSESDACPRSLPPTLGDVPTPLRAVIKSTGTSKDGRTDRTVVSTYTFQTNAEAQIAVCLGEATGSRYPVYPCKLNPGADEDLSMRFMPSPVSSEMRNDASQLLSRTSGTTSCLESPQAPGKVAISTTCTPTDADYEWTVHRSEDAQGQGLTYGQRYTIVHGEDLCLGRGSPEDLPDTLHPTAVVSPCDGSAGQKWNVSLDSSRLTDTHEEKPPAK